MLLLGLMSWWTWASATGLVGYRGVATMEDGSPVVLSLLRVETIDGSDRYTVSSGPTLIRVVGSTEGLAVGEDVTIGGTVLQGAVIETWRADAPARGQKRWLGVAGLGSIAILLPLALRRTPEGLALRG